MMSRSRIAPALCIVASALCGAAYAGPDVVPVLRLMPADFPIAVVVPDFEALDKSMASVNDRLNPGGTEPGMLAELKSELSIGDWIDFSKPVGLAAPRLGGGDEWIVLWARIPDFAEKVKSVTKAAQTEGVWELPFQEGKTFFATVKSDYVVASDSRSTLAGATKTGRSLADELKSRMYLLENRSILIHVNMAPVRQTLMAGIAQISQMAPMFAMMAGQQGGGDPAMMAAMFTGLADAAKRLVEQLAYLDVTLGITDKAIDATLAAGFTEGPIKSYLAKQKPASVPLLVDVEQQPYFVAMGYHVPREGSPFFDYMIDTISSAISKAPAAAGPARLPMQPARPVEEGNAGGQTDDLEKAMRVARDMYRNIDGQNMVVAMSPGGMRVAGDYIAKNPKAFVELFKQSLVSANPLMKQFAGGATYEALGTEEIAAISVHQFVMKFDTTNPGGAMAAKMYGENLRFGLGAVKDRVRFCMGGEEQMRRFFGGGKIEKPFANGRYVKEALAATPARRNAILLVDPVGVLPMLGPMLGLPKTDAIPPGPPAAIAVSLAGEPARVDVHVPLRAIERLMQALGPDEPL